MPSLYGTPGRTRAENNKSLVILILKVIDKGTKAILDILILLSFPKTKGKLILLKSAIETLLTRNSRHVGNS